MIPVAALKSGRADRQSQCATRGLDAVDAGKLALRINGYLVFVELAAEQVIQALPGTLASEDLGIFLIGAESAVVAQVLGGTAEAEFVLCPW